MYETVVETEATVTSSNGQIQIRSETGSAVQKTIDESDRAVRVIRMLREVAAAEHPLTANEISERTELPKATVDARPPAPKVPPITLSVREDGTIFWADEALAGKEMLDTRLAVEAQKEPQPDVLLRADKETKYALIQDVTTRVRVAGMRSINFVSEPESGN